MDQHEESLVIPFTCSLAMTISSTEKLPNTGTTKTIYICEFEMAFTTAVYELMQPGNAIIVLVLYHAWKASDWLAETKAKEAEFG